MPACASRQWLQSVSRKRTNEATKHSPLHKSQASSLARGNFNGRKWAKRPEGAVLSEAEGFPWSTFPDIQNLRHGALLINS